MRLWLFHNATGFACGTLYATYPVTKKRLYIILTSIILFGLLVDFSPVIYYKIVDGGATWPQFYNYNERPHFKMQQVLKKFKSDKIDIIYQPDSSKNKDYLKVLFYDKEYKDYFHTWVYVDSIESPYFNQIVFAYVGKTQDQYNAKAINKDFDIIKNRWTIKRFESLVINKLKVE